MTQGTKTTIDPGIVARVAAGVRYAFTGKAPDWFGPQAPLPPMVPTEQRDSVAGRRFDYQVGYNVQTRPRSNDPVSFEQMRALAESYDILRLVIETRKDQMEKLRWSIKPKDAKAKPDARCAEIEKFFRRPDKENTWTTWLRMILEDLLVIDAPTLYVRETLGGDLYALEPVDGATIKPVIDDHGRRPPPGEVAYQQILKGVPAVDYTADELIYRPRNRRTHKVYGYSPVEQIIITVNIALRRQANQLSYYTEGNVPNLLFSVPKEWNPDQIRQFQEWWDSVTQGQTKHYGRFIPEGAKPVEIKQPPLKDMYDEWLARVVCFCFSIEPTPFVAQVNRSVAETSRQQSLAEGLGPLKTWVKELVDEVIETRFGISDVEFGWIDDDVSTPKEKAEIAAIYVGAKVITPDEARADIGLEPLTPEQRAESWPAPPAMVEPTEDPEPQSEKIEKYNPYHDAKGRFTSADGAAFVSITNHKTVETMRTNAKSGKPVGIQSKTEPTKHPSVKSGHVELNTHREIVKETDKAVAIKDGIGFRPGDNTPSSMRGSGVALQWLPKSQISTHEGKVTGMPKWLASKSSLATKDDVASGKSTVVSQKFDGSLEAAEHLEEIILKSKGLKAKKAPRPIDRDRPAVGRATNEMAKTMAGFLAAQAPKIAGQLSELIADAEKGMSTDSGRDKAWRILQQIDFDEWEDLPDMIGDVMVAIAVDAGGEALKQIDLTSDADVMSIMRQRAESWAKDRAAEMVGMKYVDGELVPNPNAVWQITDGTREWLRGMTEQALAEGWSTQEMAGAIKQDYAFSPERAEMIARTEIARADIAGSVRGWSAAGIKEKEWLVAPECCDECQEMDGKKAPIDGTFEGGKDVPLHPKCRCDVLPVIESEE